MSSFTPFADDRTTLAIGELNAENGVQSLAIYGSLDISRDQMGLVHARALEALAHSIVETLQSIPNLPTKVTEQASGIGEAVKNPFT